MARSVNEQCVFSLILIIVLAIQPSASIFGQSPRRNSEQKQPTGSAEVDVPRWRSLLDQLVVEARALPQEKTRPSLIAEIADAYWDIDKTKSGELFMSALEAALSVGRGAKDSRSALRQVIALAAKRDLLLAKQLTDKTLQHSGENGWAPSASLAAASDLIESDPGKAAQLLVANAATGPSLDVAWFILQLYKRDPAIAEGVYSTYLDRFTPSPSFSLDRLLSLAGYPFGYSEAFGVDSAQIIGFNGLRSPRIAANPALARTFLNVAFRATQHTLDQAASAPAPKAEAINGIALFTILYLLPEAESYLPHAVQGWQRLYQRAAAGTPAPQQESITKRLHDIVEARHRGGTHEAMQPPGSGDPQAFLDRAEKLPHGCKRDQEYLKAVIKLGHSKEFIRAFEAAERINTLSMRDAVRQYLYYDRSKAALEAGDPGNLVDARKYADLVTSQEHRALLYVKIANAALRHKDRQQAAELLMETRRLAENIKEPSLQASVLLVSSAGFAEFDPTEAREVLRDAIKAVNRVRDQNVDSFSILRRIDFNCSAEEPSWYGGSEQAERFSLNETLASVASLDVEGALLIARDIDNDKSRIRALASIIRAVVKRQ